MGMANFFKFNFIIMVNSSKAFTIIELIVVISIIAMLSVLGLSTYSSVQVDARNAKRKEDLKEIQKALEIYKNENGSYPSTIVGSSRQWYGLCNPNPWGPDDLTVDGADQYIPGLSPDYMQQLPKDPRDNTTNSSSARTQCQTNPNENCYLYSSDGVDFKLLAHCSPEGTLSSDDPFYDPCRASYAWQVSSSSTVRGTKGVTCNWSTTGW